MSLFSKNVDIYIIKYKDIILEETDVFDDKIDESLSYFLSSHGGIDVLDICKEMEISLVELINNLSIEKK